MLGPGWKKMPLGVKVYEIKKPPWGGFLIWAGDSTGKFLSDGLLLI